MGTYPQMRARAAAVDKLPPDEWYTTMLSRDPLFGLARMAQQAGDAFDPKDQARLVRSAALRTAAAFCDRYELPNPFIPDASKMTAVWSRRAIFNELDSHPEISRVLEGDERAFFAILEKRGVYMEVPRHTSGPKKGTPRSEGIRLYMPDLELFFEELEAPLPQALVDVLHRGKARYTDRSKRPKPKPPRRRSGQ